MHVTSVPVSWSLNNVEKSAIALIIRTMLCSSCLMDQQLFRKVYVSNKFCLGLTSVAVFWIAVITPVVLVTLMTELPVPCWCVWGVVLLIFTNMCVFYQYLLILNEQKIKLMWLLLSYEAILSHLSWSTKWVTW